MLGNEPRHASGLRTSDTGQTDGDLSPGNDPLTATRSCEAATRAASSRQRAAHVFTRRCAAGANSPKMEVDRFTNIRHGLNMERNKSPFETAEESRKNSFGIKVVARR